MRCAGRRERSTEVRLEELDGLDAVSLRRLRHVVSENRRVSTSPRRSRSRRPRRRPDASCSRATRACATTTRCRSPELDLLVELAEEAGALRRAAARRRLRRLDPRARRHAAGGRDRVRGRVRYRERTGRDGDSLTAHPSARRGGAALMGRVVVTGGSGKAGRAVVADLLAHGDDVLSVDLVRSAAVCRATSSSPTSPTSARPSRRSRGAEAVVHLAAIPAPGLRPDELTFRRQQRRARTTSSAPRRRSAFAASSGPRARRCSGFRSSASGPRTRRSTRSTRLSRSSATRSSKLISEEMARPVQPLDRNPVRRPALLERDGAARLRQLPRVLGRPGAAPLEPLGLRRCTRRRAVVPARTARPTPAGPRSSSSPPRTP